MNIKELREGKRAKEYNQTTYTMYRQLFTSVDITFAFL